MLQTHVEARPARSRPQTKPTPAKPAATKVKAPVASAPAHEADPAIAAGGQRAERWTAFLARLDEAEGAARKAVAPREADETDAAYLDRLLAGAAALRHAIYGIDGRRCAFSAMVDEADTIRSEQVVDDRLLALEKAMGHAIVAIPTRSLAHLEEKWRIQVDEFPDPSDAAQVMFAEAVAMAKGKLARTDRDATMAAAGALLHAMVMEKIASYGDAFDVVEAADLSAVGRGTVVTTRSAVRLEPTTLNLPLLAHPLNGCELFEAVSDLYVAGLAAEAICQHKSLSDMLDDPTRGHARYRLLGHLRHMGDILGAMVDRIEIAMEAMVDSMLDETPAVKRRLALRWAARG